MDQPIERPTSVRLGGLTFPITYEGSNLENRLIGAISLNDVKMFVSNDVNGERQKEIVLHEILHGIDHIIGAGDRVKEEENVARTEVLFTFLREPRNRAALEWIMHEDT
jgi:hypothetical protein